MVTFQTEGVAMPRINKKVISAWLSNVALGYGFKVGCLNYLFCNDEKILQVNLQFLGHDYYTDIITFDYSDTKQVSGDMYISLDTVQTNSVAFGKEYADELHRVIVHGLLHLCGIDDKGRGQRAVMQRAEDKALELLAAMPV